MVALEVDEDLLVERLLKRGETSGRADDQDESKIRNRFNEYNTKTAVLKDYYRRSKQIFWSPGSWKYRGSYPKALQGYRQSYSGTTHFI